MLGAFYTNPVRIFHAIFQTPANAVQDTEELDLGNVINIHRKLYNPFRRCEGGRSSHGDFSRVINNVLIYYHIPDTLAAAYSVEEKNTRA